MLSGTTPAVALPGPFEAHGSVNQVYTFGHPAGSTVQLLDAASTVVASGTADAQGAFLFKEVATGTGYQVTEGAGTVSGLTVSAPTDHPPFSWYQGHQLGAAVPNGNLFTYIPTRDGTLLSANIVFPKDGSPGPWPVLIDYSGYDPSEPPGTPQETQMYPYAGYVTVGINLRGTTCSGGAFDIWETLQTLDGYDAVETLAAQSWSTGHVGLVGISFPGISQLFVAQTQPPHLDAISPLSTYADFYGGIGYPGGIINSGFFLDWLASRDGDSNPAAHGWVQQRIANGDTTCQQNQVMRLQSHKLIPEAVPNRFNEARGNYLSPQSFVDKIKVPTFLVGQFQDEQTGGQWATMIGKFDPTTKLKVQLTNGTHVEGMGPQHMPRLLEFLDFYVKRRVPRIPGTLRIGLPPGLQDLFSNNPSSGSYAVPIDRFACYIAPASRPAIHPDCTGIVLPNPTQDDYAGALAVYEAEPKVHVSWENGNGPAPAAPGEPFAAVQGDYASWPLPGTSSVSYYFGPDGTLTTTPPTVPDAEARGYSSYRYDPASKNPKQTFNGGTDGMWAPMPSVTWKPLAEGASLNFLSSPFATKTAMAGSASADVWIRSTETDTDLEVTLTEVRPDGKETFIQSGWLRASRRALATGSTALLPRHSHLAADAQPLTPGQFALARVEIYPFAHVIRPGSRLRINIEVPGGNQAFWKVDPMVFGHPVTNDVAHSVGRPSKIVLPIVHPLLNPPVPAALPACPGLRGQACRAYVPARIPTNVAATRTGTDLNVTWSAPAGAPPTSYTVSVQPSGETFTVPGATTAYTYTGASPGVPVTFRVAGVYGATTAPTSDASASITVPFGQISGVVQSATGPIGGIYVAISPAAAPALLAYVVTAPDGTFTLPNVAAGAYKVLILDLNQLKNMPTYFISEWYDNASTSINDFPIATTVTVTPGATTTLNPVTLLAH
jgi:predicted acyl esterase